MYHRHDGDAYCSYFDTFTVEVVRFTNPFPSLAASFSFALRLSHTRAISFSLVFPLPIGSVMCSLQLFKLCDRDRKGGNRYCANIIYYPIRRGTTHPFVLYVSFDSRPNRHRWRPGGHTLENNNNIHSNIIYIHNI